MEKVRENVTCGIVGGSDLKKIAEQLGGMEGMDLEHYTVYEALFWRAHYSSSPL